MLHGKAQVDEVLIAGDVHRRARERGVNPIIYWLARAVHAPRDAAWIADGVIAASWSPVSPVTGRLDAFEWKVPVSDVAAR